MHTPATIQPVLETVTSALPTQLGDALVGIYLYGSAAWGDFDDDISDIDLLVDLPEGASLFDRAELKSALEELLLTRVDLIRRRNLKPGIREVVEAEAVTL